jgi:hypothetical protein
MTWRAWLFAPLALRIVHRKAIREGRAKNERELRREALVWRLCGEHDLAEVFEP